MAGWHDLQWLIISDKVLPASLRTDHKNQLKLTKELSEKETVS